MGPDIFESIEPPKKKPGTWIVFVLLMLFVVFGYFVGNTIGYTDGLADATKSSTLQTKLMSNVCYRIGYAVGSDTNEQDIAVMARIYRACSIGE